MRLSADQWGTTQVCQRGTTRVRMAANHREADLMTVLAFLLDVRHLARAEGRDREVGVKAEGEGQG
eukprot:scaffold33213_cov60-Phaeocystis_antarctica.AAC.13